MILCLLTALVENYDYCTACKWLPSHARLISVEEIPILVLTLLNIGRNRTAQCFWIFANEGTTCTWGYSLNGLNSQDFMSVQKVTS